MNAPRVKKVVTISIEALKPFLSYKIPYNTLPKELKNEITIEITAAFCELIPIDLAMDIAFPVIDVQPASIKTDQIKYV